MQVYVDESAIAWAVGRGGDWRRRAEPLVEKVVDLGP
jgi:hypothetical protein